MTLRSTKRETESGLSPSSRGSFRPCRWFWPYWVGAALLAALNTVLTAVYRPWGVTSAITNWAAGAWSLLGGHPENWAYYRIRGLPPLAAPGPWLDRILNDGGTLLDLGMVAGVLLAAASRSEFRLKPIRSGRQAVRAIVGGVLMGYGARLGFGCNIGALLGGIASQSLHGWVFGLFVVLGAATGTSVVAFLSRPKTDGAPLPKGGVPPRKRSPSAERDFPRPNEEADEPLGRGA